MDRRSIRWGAVVACATLAFLPVFPGVALAATVTAEPSSIAPGGSVNVTAVCTEQATSATLSGTSFGGPSQIAMVPEVGTPVPGTFAADVTIPSTTLAGTYDLSVTCSDGDSGLGTLTVTPSGTNAGEGPMGLNTGALVGGAALLALGAAGAFILSRRRGRTTA
jgi:hypothetical protein